MSTWVVDVEGVRRIVDDVSADMSALLGACTSVIAASNTASDLVTGPVSGSLDGVANSWDGVGASMSQLGDDAVDAARLATASYVAADGEMSSSLTSASDASGASDPVTTDLFRAGKGFGPW